MIPCYKLRFLSLLRVKTVLINTVFNQLITTELVEFF